ncbi:hypothetical protein EJ110_NYTH07332 [Nymphaea thermarum]|nr:hypothetical protein EJ110_NYTH07332 [Nymphaea thermarum]
MAAANSGNPCQSPASYRTGEWEKRAAELPVAELTGRVGLPIAELTGRAGLPIAELTGRAGLPVAELTGRVGLTGRAVAKRKGFPSSIVILASFFELVKDHVLNILGIKTFVFAGQQHAFFCTLKISNLYWTQEIQTFIMRSLRLLVVSFFRRAAVFKDENAEDTLSVVNSADYDSCNTQNPIKTCTDGNSVVELVPLPPSLPPEPSFPVPLPPAQAPIEPHPPTGQPAQEHQHSSTVAPIQPPSGPSLQTQASATAPTQAPASPQPPVPAQAPAPAPQSLSQAPDSAPTPSVKSADSAAVPLPLQIAAVVALTIVALVVFLEHVLIPVA